MQQNYKGHMTVNIINGEQRPSTGAAVSYNNDATYLTI